MRLFCAKFIIPLLTLARRLYSFCAFFVLGGVNEWHANAATDVAMALGAFKSRTPTLMVPLPQLLPFVETWEVGEAAVGQCDMESADTVGGGVE